MSKIEAPPGQTAAASGTILATKHGQWEDSPTRTEIQDGPFPPKSRDSEFTRAVIAIDGDLA